MDEQRPIKETAALLLAGDGVLALVQPAAHCRAWRAGEGWWSGMLEWFAARPQLVRAAGAAELAVAIWLARPRRDA